MLHVEDPRPIAEYRGPFYGRATTAEWGSLMIADDEAIDARIDKLATAIVNDAGNRLEEHRESHEEFRERLKERWGRGLAGYLVVWLKCRDSGAQIGAQGPLADALIGIHARATRAALEVYHLLREGLPRAAMARSRTLFELAVYSELITAEPRLAPRFLASARLQQAKDAVDLNASGGHYGTFSKEEMVAFEDRSAEAKRTHDGLAKRNGWASLDGSDVTFRQLAEQTSLKSEYPFYNWFSHEVHAGARGSVLNTIPTREGGYTFLVGYTNSGLADPAMTAMRFYTSITLDLLNTCGEIDEDEWAAIGVITKTTMNWLAETENRVADEGLNSELSDIIPRPTTD